jgi:hypothetical protein
LPPVSDSSISRCLLFMNISRSVANQVNLKVL